MRKSDRNVMCAKSVQKNNRSTLSQWLANIKRTVRNDQLQNKVSFRQINQQSIEIIFYLYQFSYHAHLLITSLRSCDIEVFDTVKCIIDKPSFCVAVGREWQLNDNKALYLPHRSNCQLSEKPYHKPYHNEATKQTFHV